MSCKFGRTALAIVALGFALALSCGGGETSAPDSSSAAGTEPRTGDAPGSKTESPGEADPSAVPSEPTLEPGTQLPRGDEPPEPAPADPPAKSPAVPITAKPSEPTPTPSPTPAGPSVTDPGGAIEVAATKDGLERIGAPKCKMCHKVQYNSWAESAHAQREPQLDCEGCHGPGSEYKGMSVMKDPDQATAAGLVRPDREFCSRCHAGEWDDTLLARSHAHKE